jgi:N,N'-diacetyllegionaminate synthase
MNFKIKERQIGNGCPLFFIAEAGVNHNGSLDMGKELIDIALKAGADAVKFQTFNTEKIITLNAPKSSYHIETTGEDSEQTWFELLKTQEMSRSMHVELIEYCNRKGIIFLSTPYDEESVDLLYDLDVPAFKIASTDTSNIPLIQYIARKKRPMIISTAMANMKEVEDAVAAVRSEGLEDIAILQCTGNYPSKLSDSNLRVMKTYRDKLNCIVGYSDHTPDMINPVAATALGAKIYEKHFTIDKNLSGPDHRMSLDPMSLKETIIAIRYTEKSLGSQEKRVLPAEEENRRILRKSLVAIKDISKGSLISKNMIGIKRPGTGLPPSLLEQIIGKKAKIDILKDSILTDEIIDIYS